MSGQLFNENFHRFSLGHCSQRLSVYEVVAIEKRQVQLTTKAK
jgi:hypothetical protein